MFISVNFLHLGKKLKESKKLLWPRGVTFFWMFLKFLTKILRNFSSVSKTSHQLSKISDIFSEISHTFSGISHFFQNFRNTVCEISNLVYTKISHSFFAAFAVDFADPKTQCFLAPLDGKEMGCFGNWQEIS